MEIKTKLNIGDKYWVVYRHDLEISLYIDTVEEISYNPNMGIAYFGEYCQEEIKETDIIEKDDTEGLLKEILRLQKEIENEEAAKNDE